MLDEIEMAVKIGANLREVIQTHTSLLLRCMDPSMEFMFYLHSVAYITQQQLNFPAKATTDWKILTLLKVLREVPDEECQSVQNGIIAALRASGQDLLWKHKQGHV